MYARSTTTRADPENIDDGIAHIRDKGMPFVHGQEAMEQSRAQAMALQDRVATETAVDVLGIAEFELGVAPLPVPQIV